MSHKATNWLSTIPADMLGHSEFRVLFHLCDCHNPAQGCFPTQAYLVDNCGLSRSTLNVALSSMEEKGLIRRHQFIDERTRRQRPTHYILGFEFDAAQAPCPNSGHGNSDAPCPTDRTRAVSDFEAKPCPENRKSRVRPTGHKPVIEPVRNQRAPKSDASEAAGSTAEVLEMWAEKIRNGGYVPASAIRPDQAREMVRLGLVTVEQLKKAGISI